MCRRYLIERPVTGAPATRGVAWTVASGLVARGVGLVGTLIITRFLAPDVVGEVTTATVLAFAASWITQLGFNQYVLVRGENTGIAVSCDVRQPGAGGDCAVAYGARRPAPRRAGSTRRSCTNICPAWRWRYSSAASVLRRTSCCCAPCVSALWPSPGACGELAYAATAVSLIALFDFGGHGIVIGNIVQSIVIVAITIGACGVRDWLMPTRLHWQRFKEVLSFGAPLGLETMLYEFARYGDKLVYTRLFGPARTGEYSLAANLADLPAVYVGEQVSNVLLPTMLQVQGERRQAMLARAIGMLAMLTFPMAIGLAAIAHTLVDVLLPPQLAGRGAISRGACLRVAVPAHQQPHLAISDFHGAQPDAARPGNGPRRDAVRGACCCSARSARWRPPSPWALLHSRIAVACCTRFMVTVPSCARCSRACARPSFPASPSWSQF